MNIKTILTLLGAVIILLTVTSCSSTKVQSDVDPTFDFTKNKSFEYYGWANKSDQMLNDIDKKRIENAFADELYKRGLGYVATGGELIIALHIVVEQKQQTTATTTGMGGGYGGYGGYYGYGPGYGWGGGYSTTQVSTYNYAVGTLIISVYDKVKEQLVWESSGQGEINESTKGREDRIKYVVAKIMKEYPIPPIPEEK